jgi:hypothetical protein
LKLRARAGGERGEGGGEVGGGGVARYPLKNIIEFDFVLSNVVLFNRVVIQLTMPIIKLGLARAKSVAQAGGLYPMTVTPQDSPNVDSCLTERLEESFRYMYLVQANSLKPTTTPMRYQFLDQSDLLSSTWHIR